MGSRRLVLSERATVCAYTLRIIKGQHRSRGTARKFNLQCVFAFYCSRLADPSNPMCRLMCPRNPGREGDGRHTEENGDIQNLVVSMKKQPFWKPDKTEGTSKAEAVMPRCLQTARGISTWISSVRPLLLSPASDLCLQGASAKVLSDSH